MKLKSIKLGRVFELNNMIKKGTECPSLSTDELVTLLETVTPKKYKANIIRDSVHGDRIEFYHHTSKSSIVYFNHGLWVSGMMDIDGRRQNVDINYEIIL